MSEIKTYRLFQICESIRKALDNASGGKQYWIIAEVASLSIRKGHRYIELVDSENNVPIARLQANFWASDYQRIKLEKQVEPDAILEAGKRVLLLCSISFHELYGLKLSVHDLNPEFTLGDMEQKKREAIQRLEKEKLLRLNAQKKLPAIIKKIGIISSASASGFEDFIQHLGDNAYAYHFAWKLFDTPVQGQMAELPICNAIAEAQLYNLDMLVLIRGGGSRLDLEVFNAYSIAAAIANSRIPVFTGLGHETDETVADLVAHTRCKTPTAVAHAIIEYNMDFHARLQYTVERITKQAQLLLKFEKEQIKLHFEILKRLIEKNIAEHKKGLLEMKTSLNRQSISILHYHSKWQEKMRFSLIQSVSSNLVEQKIAIRKSAEQLRKGSQVLLQKAGSERLLASNQLNSLSLRFIQNVKMIHDNIDARISLVHPSNILRKGFAIVMKKKQVVTKMTEISVGDELHTHLLNFSFSSTVKKIDNNPENER
jgi:exodeoxyribonuclease VII large subunit